MILTRILLRLLGDTTYKQVSDRLIQEWLVSLSTKDCGYKGYYSIRKKAIQGAIGVGLEQKEYWMYLGRMAELKQLNQLSLDARKKAEDKRPKKLNKNGDLK